MACQKSTACYLIENLLTRQGILTHLFQALETRSNTRLVVQPAGIPNAIHQACRSEVSQDTFEQGDITQIQTLGDFLAGPARFRVPVKKDQEA
jgi:hypothetical protein